MVDDETVSQFMAFTACQDAETAVSYLEMSGGNLETAAGLFMEHAANADGVTTTNNNNDSTSSSSVPGHNNGPVAPLLQGHHTNVRAPDETRRERLVGGPNPELDHILPGLLRPQLMNRRSDRAAAFADSDDEELPDGVRIVARDVREQVNRAAGHGADESGNDDHHNNNNNNNTIGQRATKLSDMFAPPDHILHKAGGFQGARAVARDTRRWLLVNLQRDSEFSSHALNRDVWANDLVENLIVSSFIFWQAFDDSTDGATYVQRYGVHEFPHVAIIDPRTGRLMWKKEGWNQVKPLTAEEFAQKAADFCSLHSFDKPPSAQPGIKPNRPVKRPVEELSEEEQLAKAIRESQGMDDDMDDDMDDESIDQDNSNEDMEDDTNDDNIATSTSTQPPPPQRIHTLPVPLPVPPPKPTFEEEILSMDVGTEPLEGGARLQFRMPDGGRVVRKFQKEDNVKVIYAFVAQSSEEAKTGKSFVLRSGFPPKDLIDKMHETIASCSLSGESVTVRWK